MLCFVLIRSRVGRVLVAIRENEERVKMLGYHTFRYKLLAMALSGLLSGAAGAAYALMFGYVGATFASIEYSILPCCGCCWAARARSSGRSSARC